MKSLLKKLYSWLSDLAATIVSIVSILAFSSFKVARRMRKLKDVGKGKDVLVLANGPSLREVLEKKMDYLKENDCIVVNFFGNTDYFFKIKPRYYILLDPAFFKKQKSETVNSNIDKLVANLNKVDWPMTLFIPYTKDAVKTGKERVENENISIDVYNSNRVQGFISFQNLIYRRCLGIPSSINVSLPAIILMINLGYKNVYLHGVEFSWLKAYVVDELNGRIYLNDGHFYEGNNRLFIPKGGYKFDVGCILDALDATERIQNYAIYRNVCIVNRTRGSYIDAFPYEYFE